MSPVKADGKSLCQRELEFGKRSEFSFIDSHPMPRLIEILNNAKSPNLFVYKTLALFVHTQKEKLPGK